MKNIVYLLILLAFIETSCSKKDGSTDLQQPVQNTDPYLPVPDRFTKKVLLEELTAIWCGYCPRGNHFQHYIDSAYGDKAICVSIHVADALEDMQLVTATGLNLLDSGLFHNFDTSDTGYPNSAVNRAAPLKDPSLWPSIVPGQVSLYAKCGLAIDASSVAGNVLTVTVHAGFAQPLSSDYRLNVYLIESDVHSATNSSYSQHNYYSNNGGSHPDSTYFYYGNATPVSYYNLNTEITDFRHDNVLRKLLTSVPFGDQIPVSEMGRGKQFVKTYTVDLSGYDISKCSIVAFVDKFGTDFLNNEHQVQNVQRVKVYSKIMWD